MPVLDLVVSATALDARMANGASDVGTRVFEVYGCTRPAWCGDGAPSLALYGHDARCEIERSVMGPCLRRHVQPGPLADCLRLISDSTFELEGRTDDVVNIGGKRASLQGLNRVLLSIDGVVDGVIFEPPNAPAATREQRLMALVVAPDVTRAELLAAVRAQIDPVFSVIAVGRCIAQAQGNCRSRVLALATSAGRVHGRSSAVQGF